VITLREALDGFDEFKQKYRQLIANAYGRIAELEGALRHVENEKAELTTSLITADRIIERLTAERDAAQETAARYERDILDMQEQS
jgi:hypothetical protein